MEELSKDKARGARRARTNSAIGRQVAIHRQHGGTPLARGFFKKHHATDASLPRNALAGNARRRSSKLKERLTIQELRALEEDNQLRRYPQVANDEGYLTAA